VDSKISELTEMGVPFLVICGDRAEDPRVLHRIPNGKWDAINYGMAKVPSSSEVIVMNDVDTKIHRLDRALRLLEDGTDIVYCKVYPTSGPQVRFYKLLDLLRRSGLHIAASGELLIAKKEVLDSLLPIPPCIAEDTLLVFRALESGYRVRFCEETFVVTRRTEKAEEEVRYKSRTTQGIYQALSHSNPPILIKVFYAILPLLSLLLLCVGRDGRAWWRGIRDGFRRFVAGEAATRF